MVTEAATQRDYRITEASVENYLQDKLKAAVKVTSLRQTFPGSSRETYIARAKIGTEDRGFVIRVDLPHGGGVPFSLQHEWEVYRRLWDSPVPVAEPLWYDEDVDFAQGRPHMLRELVEGGTTIAGLTDATNEGAALRRSIVRDHVERLAQLHTMDWQKYGFDQFLAVPSDPTDAIRLEFETWKKFWLEGKTEAFPLITEALYWLEENIPTDNPMISLFKGNNGVGEEIYRDNRIVAMSDWELASLGDGAFDLGFSQGSLALDDFGAAVKYYGECVGHEVSPQRLAFSMFWVMFKIIVCLDTCFLGKSLSGVDKRVLSPALGIMRVQSARHSFAKSIGKDIVSALHDLKVGNEKSVYADIGDTE